MSELDDFELVELGDDWLNAPCVAICNRCRRNTWAADAIGTEDRMTQPDGNPCGGKFVAR